jgi:hypothetical protein
MYSILLSKGSYIGFSKPLAKALKSIEAALMLSEILDKIEYHQRTAKENSVRVPKYIFITAEKFTDNLLLSAYQQRKAIKILVEFGLIETKLCGIPAKLHFKIPSGFNASIEKCLQQVVKKIDNCELSNLTTNYKTKDKNINNFLNDEKKEALKTEIYVKQESTFTDNGNLKTNSDENNYIDFTDEKINFGYLGKCKGLFQTYLNLLTFSEYEDKIIKGIFYSIKDNLTAYNKKQGTNTPIQDKNVLDALKIALQAFTIKPLPSGKMNLVYFRGSLNANVYIKIDDTAKLLDLVGSEQRANYYNIAARDGASIATEKLRNLLTKQGKI